MRLVLLKRGSTVVRKVCTFNVGAIFTVRNEVAKVMFLHVSVILLIGR